MMSFFSHEASDFIYKKWREDHTTSDKIVGSAYC